MVVQGEAGLSLERASAEHEKDTGAEHRQMTDGTTASKRVPPEVQKNEQPAYHELDKSITIDTIHNDEGLRVLANYHGDIQWTSEEEKRLAKKIDRRLLSIVVTTYGLQYNDKAMLGQAALFGLVEDLNLDIGNRYSFSSAIFYLG